MGIGKFATLEISKSMGRFLEVCSVSVADVREAAAGGAGRIELCENIEVGGVTPSQELIGEVLRVSPLPVNVLVRPRGGDFVFTADEEAQMRESILMCRRMGVNGVVIGALRRDGSVDTEMMRRLVDAAGPMPVTFHRAFDCCSEPYRALEEIISLGCSRLLTSGQKESAYDGRELIAGLVSRAGGRIVIMPGGGVRTSNIAEIEAATRAAEFHSTSRGASGATERSVVAALVGSRLV